MDQCRLLTLADRKSRAALLLPWRGETETQVSTVLHHKTQVIGFNSLEGQLPGAETGPHGSEN